MTSSDDKLWEAVDGLRREVADVGAGVKVLVAVSSEREKAVAALGTRLEKTECRVGGVEKRIWGLSGAATVVATSLAVLFERVFSK